MPTHSKFLRHNPPIFLLGRNMKQLLLTLPVLVGLCLSAPDASADITGWNVTADDGFVSDSSSLFSNTGLITFGAAFNVTAEYDTGSNLLTLNYINDFTGASVNWLFSITSFDNDPAEFITSVSVAPPTMTLAPNLIDGSTFSIATPEGGPGTSFTYLIETNFSAATVPEPSSVAMLCALGLGGVWVRRRRQTSAA
ncbi:MAG: PEP-CTERM sorting domain-containing protein [Fuerstiella sp.]